MRKLIILLCCSFLLCCCSNGEDDEIFTPFTDLDLNISSGELNREGDTITIMAKDHVSISPFLTDDQELKNSTEEFIYVSDKIRHRVLTCSWFKFINEYDARLNAFAKIILIVYPNETGMERTVPFDVVSNHGYSKTSFIQSK